MATPYSVTLANIIKEFSLELIYTPKSPEEIKISSVEVSRPAVHLAGYYEYFDAERLEVFGKTEEGLIAGYDDKKRIEALRTFFGYEPPAVIYTRNNYPNEDTINIAKEFEVPILLTPESTSAFMASLISFLNTELAPRITRHGVLVEVYGEGVLILGESGVGKSETAIELVKRGHRLIADDAVEIRRVSNKTLVGSSPDNIRHFIELRGIGIINARRIFGMGSVKLTEKIDMIISLEPWDNNKIYDRMGLENEKKNILGIEVQSVTVPVKPGRNLAVIIEVAAMNNRQKKMGYNPAEELLHKLGMNNEEPSSEDIKNWESF
jgi:HPr kinase/phosphorylase